MMEEDLRSVPRAAAKTAAEGIAWYLGRKVGIPVKRAMSSMTFFLSPEYAVHRLDGQCPDDENARY